MGAKTLGVGIIGASADRGWAKDSHVPAVQGLAGLELVAVASGSQAKGAEAAKTFGAKVGYGDGLELIRDANVDIVTIAVKVPDHRELVLAAIASGKHIYCEWPLGRDLAETEELAAAAKAAGVHVAVGLQTRANPAMLRARELVGSGVIGRVLSARIVSTTMAFGPKVEAAMAFAEDAGNGVTLMTIQGAHTMDCAIAVLGPLAEVATLATIQYAKLEVGDPAVAQTRSIADHLLLQSRLQSGGALSVEVAGGRPAEEVRFRLEVTGEHGEVVLQGGAVRGFQSGRLSVLLNGVEESVDEGEITSMTDEAANVAGNYARLRDDISIGSWTAPDVDHAVRLTRLVGDVVAAGETGTRKVASDWPM